LPKKMKEKKTARAQILFNGGKRGKADEGLNCIAQTKEKIKETRKKKGGGKGQQENYGKGEARNSLEYQTKY